MSSANHKGDPFEEEFRRRMHDAEATPSPDLWSRIDHDLTVQENKHYKGRMVLYRQLAAACFVLFVLAGALLTFNFSNKGQSVATTDKKQNPVATETGVAAAKEAQKKTVTVTEAPEKIAANKAVPSINAAEPRSEVKHYVAAAAKSNAKLKATYSSNNKDQAQDNSLPTAESSMTAAVKFAHTLPDTDFDIRNSEASEPKTIFKSLEPFYNTTGQTIATLPAGSNRAANTTNAVPSVVVKPSVLAMLKEYQEESKVEAQQKQNETVVLALNDASKDAQPEEKSQSDSRWSVGMAYAPSYFNQNIGIQNPSAGSAMLGKYSLAAPQGALTSTESARNMDEAQDEFDKNTDPAFSFGVEFKSGFKLSKKLKVLAGLGFTQNASRTKSSYILEQFAIKPSTNERVPLKASTVFLPSLNSNFSTDSVNVAKTDDFEVRYRYRHFTLPAGLQYEGKISKDWYWYAAGGVAVNFLIETKIMASSNEVNNVKYDFDDNSPFRKVQLSGNISAGVGKQLSNSVSVMVGPEYRNYFNSLLTEPNKALAPQGKPYTIGLNMAINYNLIN